MLDKEGSKPIYIQIANWIEAEIIDGTLEPDAKVYSQYQLAEIFNINPATAGKGLSLLLEAEIIYKRRGLGTFVAPGAIEKLRLKRKNETLRQLIINLLNEAELLGMDDQQLLQMVEDERLNKKEEKK